ncbi:hypothetical protein EV359DRAFT_67971 [Lentinula novae-zelandiae]|nr:hypothetical protein EV359DRAFT_67971 [Lentinula novae-zelandiae]
MGAHWDYITQKSTELVHAEIFDFVEPQTIAGADHSVTKYFCRFWIWIEPIKEEICAYILEADSGFRHGFLLGQSFLTSYNVTFNWDDNSMTIVAPNTGVAVCIKLKHILGLKKQELYHTEGIHSSPCHPISSTAALTNSNLGLHNTIEEKLEEQKAEAKPGSTFGKKLKDLALNKFPGLFWKKAGYPPA